MLVGALWVWWGAVAACGWLSGRQVTGDFSRRCSATRLFLASFHTEVHSSMMPSPSPTHSLSFCDTPHPLATAPPSTTTTTATYRQQPVIVKASSGPRYVVGCRTKVDKAKLTTGTRVALDMTTLTIMRALPREVRQFACGWVGGGAECGWGLYIDSWVCMRGRGWAAGLSIFPSCCLHHHTTLTHAHVIRYITPHILHTNQVDPVVFNMLQEDPGKVDYSSIGGLSEQIRYECGCGGVGVCGCGGASSRRVERGGVKSLTANHPHPLTLHHACCHPPSPTLPCINRELRESMELPLMNPELFTHSHTQHYHTTSSHHITLLHE